MRPRLLGQTLEGMSRLLEDYLEAYDAQLRTDAETPSAIKVERWGPLRLMTFAGGRGFVTYRDLAGADAATISVWVRQALAHYQRNPEIDRVEWKTRGHDHAPHLHETLTSHDFQPAEAESIMIGEADLLDVDIVLPSSVRLRRISDEADVRVMSAMQDVAFGDPVSDQMADSLLRRLALNDGMQLWVAEAAGQVVGAGRLEPVERTDFAGIWGGAVPPGWRGQGIYRALTAARARSARAQGKTLIHSDSTSYSYQSTANRYGSLSASDTFRFEGDLPAPVRSAGGRQQRVIAGGQRLEVHRHPDGVGGGGHGAP